jgi:uncharacterized membrane protein YdfJ with MMPL/SSD domain
MILILVFRSVWAAVLPITTGVFSGSPGCCVMLLWGDTAGVVRRISVGVVLVAGSCYYCL